MAVIAASLPRLWHVRPCCLTRLAQIDLFSLPHRVRGILILIIITLETNERRTGEILRIVGVTGIVPIEKHATLWTDAVRCGAFLNIF